MAEDNALIFSPTVPASKNAVQIWNGLYGCADALALASAIKNENRLFLIVTADNHTALRLEHELAFFLQDTGLSILHFPDWETLPYDVFSPLPEIISERLKTLAQLPQVKRGALIVSVATLMHRLAPREHVLAYSFSLSVGEVFNLELNRIKLESVGYQCVSQVYQHAEFAVRGSIVDLFPMGSQAPYRIELFDDEIESIRTFDPETQRSLDKIGRIELFPAREFPFTDEAIKHFRQAFRELFPDASTKNALYSDISKGMAPGGIEYYLPLFVERTATLFDYLPADAVFVLPAKLEAQAEAFAAEAHERFEQRRFNLDRPLLKPELLFLNPTELKQRTASFAQIALQSGDAAPEAKIAFDCTPLPELTIDAKLKEPAQRLRQFIEGFDGKILFVAESAGRREGLIDRLKNFKIRLKTVEGWRDFIAAEDKLCITVAPMDQGLWLKQQKITVIPESLLSGEKAQQRRRRRMAAAKELEKIVNNLNELTIGSPVVHQEHGVGRYLGLQTLEIGGIPAEFLALEYAQGDKLYVPVSSLHLIGRYTGVDPETAPLHKLGGDQWSKAKKKAIEKIRDVAAELLEIYAKRAAKKGHEFHIADNDYQAFADAFPFEETPDQQTAIEAILEDMADRKSVV